jgi:hypothetical protein
MASALIAFSTRGQHHQADRQPAMIAAQRQGVRAAHVLLHLPHAGGA